MPVRLPLPLQSRTAFFKRPRAVGVERDSRLRETSRASAVTASISSFAVQYSALQFEVSEAVSRGCRFCEAYDLRCRQRFFMAQPKPVRAGLRIAIVVQTGFEPIADEEKVAKHRNVFALHPFTQQRGHGEPQELAQQVEHRALNSGLDVYSGPQVEGLLTSTFCIEARKAFSDRPHNLVVVAHLLTYDLGGGSLKHLPDLLAARNLGDSFVTCIVFENNNISREVRGMRAAQVQQHTVFAGHGKDLHCDDFRRRVSTIGRIRHWDAPVFHKRLYP